MIRVKRIPHAWRIEDNGSLTLRPGSDGWPSKELAEASHALEQLAQIYMRDPDYNQPSEFLYGIKQDDGHVSTSKTQSRAHLLTFPSYPIRAAFMKENADLLKLARPLL
jgi:hypothetical protein